MPDDAPVTIAVRSGRGAGNVMVGDRRTHNGGVRQTKASRFAEKFVINPVIRTALRVGVLPRAFALLETTGRRSGVRRLTPVGNGLDGDTFWLVSEHSDRADYVKNLIADPHVRVKVGRLWRCGHATLVRDDDAIARRRAMDRANGFFGWIDGIAFRTAVSEPLTIRIDLEPDRRAGDAH